MPVAKNPAASSRSIALPSTRNRVAASTATIEAVIATDGVERDAGIRQRVAVESAREDEQNRPDCEHADEQKLADEPRPDTAPMDEFSLPPNRQEAFCR